LLRGLMSLPLKEPGVPDDLKETGKPDNARINPDQDHEVSYWARRLRVSRDEVRRAIKQGGPMVKNIRQHLNIWSKAGDR
jgi:hypothetical protein